MIPRSTPYEHSPPPRDNIVTVTMPGITSCRSQLSRYTGGDPVTVLCNWSDVEETHPLHIVDANKNRFTGVPLRRRLRRAIRWWCCIVLRRKSHERDLESCDRGNKSEWEPCMEGDAVTIAALDTALPAQRSSSKLSYPTCAPRPQPAERLTAVGKSTWTTSATVPLTELEAADRGCVDPPVLYEATCRIAPRLIHGVLASPEMAEVRHRGWYRTLNPLHWALTMKELLTCWWFSVRPYQWCYSEPGRTNTAGLRDQAAFLREVRRGIHHIGRATSAGPGSGPTATGGDSVPRKEHLVLFGVSRGATTCFYTAMKLLPEEARYVSLVIVEAPFDTLDHVISASSWTPRLLRWFAYCWSDWRNIHEERVAYNFDPERVHLRCPVAFVMSLKDKRVPNECTQALIDRVRRELVPHVIPAVEVLVLRHSRHPCMAVGHKEDQDAYVAFVEGLYNKYCPAT